VKTDDQKGENGTKAGKIAAFVSFFFFGRLSFY
jgi:hypothetical protein